MVDFIISAKVIDEQLKYLVKWKASDEADWVPAYQARYKCPDAIIRYFEDREIWRVHPEHTSDTSPRVSRPRLSNG